MSSVFFVTETTLRNERSISPSKRSSLSLSYIQGFPGVPEDLEVAAEEFDGDWFTFIDESVQSGGYGYGAGHLVPQARVSAGTALPIHASGRVAVDDFDKFCVDTVREINVIFEFRGPIFSTFEIVDIIHIYIACDFHRNTCDTVSSTIHIQRFVNDLLFAGNNRDLVCSQDR